MRTLHGHTRAVNGCAFIPDGRWLATGSDDGKSRLWEVASGQEVLRFGGDQQDHAPIDCTFSADGRLLAVVGYNRQPRLWEITLRSPSPHARRGRSNFRLHTAERRIVSEYLYPMFQCSFTADGQFLATTGGDHDWTVLLWDVAAGAECAHLTFDTPDFWLSCG